METTKKELKQMYHDMVSIRYAPASTRFLPPSSI